MTPVNRNEAPWQPIAPSVGSNETPSPTTSAEFPTNATTRALTVHSDIRGNVRETFRASWFPNVPPILQLVRSHSIAGTLRGMHMHKRQWDIWHFVSGSAIVRLRYPDGTEAFGRYDAGQTLAIPPRIAHGFYTEHGCTLLYALTEEYTGDDEYGFFPFDGLDEDSHPGWPKGHTEVVISERDLRAPRLSEFEW